LEALTKDSDNTEEHGQEQINFQRGMGNNYERLEFLGDCFLKMATSISLYTQHATDDEQSLHVKRMLMICNQNIFNVAVKLQLYEYVRSISFSQDPRAWYPRDLNLAGKGKKLRHTTSHNLAKKTIADVGEALIGASLLTQYDTKRCDLAVRAVTELVCSTDHTQTSFKDYYAAYQMPKYLLVPATAGQINLAKQIGDRLGYHFKHPRLLRSAFIHPSYPFSYERIPSYQRLEFLGDSLLDMACINFLFHTWPGKDPQWLTEHKMAMVSNQFLGLLCVELGFHRHLLAFNSGLQRQITEYVVEIEEARREAQQDAVRAGGKEDDFARDFWVHTTLPPKCLPDIVEAYVGAVFVDSCYSFSEVEKFFDKHIKHYFIDISIYDTFANKHPVTFLSNFLGNRMGCDNWNVLAKQLPDVGDGMPPLVLATVIVHGVVVEAQQGTSSKYAKKGVAEKALEGLVGLTPAEFRGRFGCDCKVRRVEEEVDGEGKDVDPEGEQ
jgi:endoribonuclease Dicer